jgi:hypothetical protein
MDLSLVLLDEGDNPVNSLLVNTPEGRTVFASAFDAYADHIQELAEEEDERK